MHEGEVGPSAFQLLFVPEERKRRSSLIRGKRFGGDRRIVLEGAGRQVGALVVETPIGERRDRRAVRVEDDDPPTRHEYPRRLVEEPRGAGQVVEHVYEDEIRKRTVGVGKLLGIDDL